MKHSSATIGYRCLFAVSAVIGSSLLLSSVSVSNETQVLQVDWSAARIEEARFDSLSMPIHIWNCICVEIAAHPVGVILPNDLSGDAQRTRELLLMLEGGYEEAFLGAGGQIGAWRDNGTLAGIEFGWPGALNPVPGPAEGQHLGTVGRVENAAGEMLAEIYCFDSDQMANRVAQLESITGNALIQEKVWLGPMLLSSSKGSHAMDISGTGNVIYGDVTTGGDFVVTGDGHNVEDQVQYGENESVSGSGHSIPDMTLDASTLALPAFPSLAVNYKAQALANGTSFVGDIKIEGGGTTGLRTSDGTPLSGVVYSTGRIYVAGNGLSGTVTLVSELGVLLSGNDNVLTAAVDDVLAITLGGAVAEERIDNNILVEGRLCSFEGSLWAPTGAVEVVATGCRLTGRVVAYKIRYSGYENTLTDGCR